MQFLCSPAARNLVCQNMRKNFMTMQSFNFGTQLKMPMMVKFTRIDAEMDAKTQQMSMNINLAT